MCQGRRSRVQGGPGVGRASQWLGQVQRGQVAGVYPAEEEEEGPDLLVEDIPPDLLEVGSLLDLLVVGILPDLLEVGVLVEDILLDLLEVGILPGLPVEGNLLQRQEILQFLRGIHQFLQLQGIHQRRGILQLQGTQCLLPTDGIHQIVGRKEPFVHQTVDT